MQPGRVVAGDLEVDDGLGHGLSGSVRGWDSCPDTGVGSRTIRPRSSDDGVVRTLVAVAFVAFRASSPSPSLTRVPVPPAGRLPERLGRALATLRSRPRVLGKESCQLSVASAT